MKTLKLTSFLFFFLVFHNIATFAQEEEILEEEIEVVEQDELDTIIGIFEGIEDGMYVFTYIDEDEEKNTIEFDKISPEAEEEYDLSKKIFIGNTFEIIFLVENITDDEFYIGLKKIISLRKL